MTSLPAFDGEHAQHKMCRWSVNGLRLIRSSVFRSDDKCLDWMVGTEKAGPFVRTTSEFLWQEEPHRARPHRCTFFLSTSIADFSI
jgi:hypothetical protein